jgi:trehalose 6-phosphate synthase
MDVLEQREGIWFGWNGEIVADETQSNQLQQVKKQNIIYASIALTEEEHQFYYCQYANMVLWPGFHYRLDLMDYQQKAWQIYQKVNQRFASHLSELLQPDDLLWVHDYHLIALAAALQKQGQTQKVGFFLHIPFPCPAIFNAIPEYQQLIEQMTYYDVLGFQTESDKQAFLLCLQAKTEVEKLANGRYTAWGRSFIIRAYPIGIDPDNIQRLAETPLPAKFQEIRRELGEAKNIIACERLDYTKGIPQRFHAYEQLLANYPQHRGRIRYTQIAPTSRGEVFAY